MNFTPLRGMLETAVSVGAGVSVVGGAVLWLLREKIRTWVVGCVKDSADVGVWVDRRISGTRENDALWRKEIEDRMGEQEKLGERISQSMEYQAATLDRLTRVLERVELKQNETAELVGRIDERGRGK
jgi:hypothetical protein